MQQRQHWIGDACYGENYSSKNTAILIVDPFNDFLSEAGKLWSLTKETVKGVNLIENLKNILSAARSSGIKVVYVHIILPKRGPCRLKIPGSYTSGVFRCYPL
jgi:nicotinamidase-related amidase